jgi:hypothetical protein
MQIRSRQRQNGRGPRVRHMKRRNKISPTSISVTRLCVRGADVTESALCFHLLVLPRESPCHRNPDAYEERSLNAFFWPHPILTPSSYQLATPSIGPLELGQDFQRLWDFSSRHAGEPQDYSLYKRVFPLLVPCFT